MIDEFKKRYGPAEGMRIYSTVMPSILADFTKALSAAGPGKTVSEDYILDDRKGTLRLTGQIGKNGQPDWKAEFL